MIESLLSLKIVLVLLLGILILDEYLVRIQTLETVNFLASRASVVHQDIGPVDHFFNSNLSKVMIFTRSNPFFNPGSIQSRLDTENRTLSTESEFISEFTGESDHRGNCGLGSSRFWKICTTTDWIVSP